MTTPPEDNSAAKKALLASVGEHVILAGYQRFVERATELDAAASTFASVVETGSGDLAASKAAAQDAWRAAMAEWQEAEVFQVGPAGSTVARVMGAQDLRDDIYSWPTVNSCRVDQEIVNANYGNANFFETALINVKGLAAIEYLLFYEDAANTCPPQVAINQGPWAAIDAAELTKRRAAYARAAAAALLSSAKKLRDAWDPNAGNFLAQFAKPGENGSVYSSAQVALDELFAAMFYLDLDTKDMKLARPAGISADCTQEICPDALESPWSNYSKADVLANLRGFEKIFHGGAPADKAERSGFDDLLEGLGAQDLSTKMRSDLTAAISSVEAVPDPMRSALVDHLDSVHAAHANVKSLTDELKTRFVTLLNLRVPDEGAADND